MKSMHVRRVRKLLALTALGGASALAVSAVLAPSAKAGELEYLQLLNMRGHSVHNAAVVIAQGWAICEQLNYGDGNDVSGWVFRNTSWTQTPTLWDAQEIVLSAVEGLCPWHDHRSVMS